MLYCGVSKQLIVKIAKVEKVSRKYLAKRRLQSSSSYPHYVKCIRRGRDSSGNPAVTTKEERGIGTNSPTRGVGKL